MFREMNGCHYLGSYGKGGIGKSVICCEAMFQHFQATFRGKYCRVKLDGDQTADGMGVDEKVLDEKGAACKSRQERLKLAIQQLVGLPPKLMSKVMSEREVMN